MSQDGVTEVCVGVSFGLIAGFTSLKWHVCLKTEKVSKLKVKQTSKEKLQEANATFTFNSEVIYKTKNK